MKTRDRRNEELELEYAKAIDTITRLQTRIKKLEDENIKLRRQNDILMRAIEITQKVHHTLCTICLQPRYYPI